MSRAQRSCEILTKNIGCFMENFSTPPLMMLQLKVMIPACNNSLARLTLRAAFLCYAHVPSRWRHRTRSTDHIHIPRSEREAREKCLSYLAL